MKEEDIVTIKDEFINVELDESCRNQFFEIEIIQNGVATIKHETGRTLKLPLSYLDLIN